MLISWILIAKRAVGDFLSTMERKCPSFHSKLLSYLSSSVILTTRNVVNTLIRQGIVYVDQNITAVAVDDVNKKPE